MISRLSTGVVVVVIISVVVGEVDVLVVWVVTLEGVVVAEDVVVGECVVVGSIVGVVVVVVWQHFPLYGSQGNSGSVQHIYSKINNKFFCLTNLEERYWRVNLVDLRIYKNWPRNNCYWLDICRYNNNTVEGILDHTFEKIFNYRITF